MFARTLRLVALVTALGALAAPAALAKGPTREPVPSDPIFLPGGLVCPFDILIELVENNEIVKTFPDGRQIITGRLVERVTNLETGESIVLNVSGPGFITPSDDETVTLKGAGRALFWFFPGELGPGEPGALLLMTGRFVATAAADFSVILTFSHQGGTTENLCETLAPAA